MTNKKILICDDDEGILDMLEMILEESGYNITPVKNSLHIYDEIKKVKPDLILLDLWMPVLSGDQILRTLRKSPETNSLPVIAISASREGQRIATEAGASDFLAKPFDLDLLVSKVKEAIAA
ncbi:response regulator [Mucilaginibacter auburnensis]|uniref:Response regulator receiver domain-containing protein n=1 Tax=Mucilaginibacter auburnensis TaxID=1457233 RepID=A0A2H9VSJ1_9SPHI|nr:response regulator [Mucilaginibacter auburnensis]PJJ83791.1 response regulator receiver domain-containing protein [Mucilaginibacter auburnensis]